MFYEKFVQMLMLCSVIALPLVTCTDDAQVSKSNTPVIEEEESNTVIGYEELKEVHKCILNVSTFKVDVKGYDTHQFIEMVCEKNRNRKIEFDYLKLHKADGDMAKYMKTCLEPKQPRAFEHFHELGKRVKKARVFIDQELMHVQPISFSQHTETEVQRKMSELKKTLLSLEESQAADDTEPNTLLPLEDSQAIDDPEPDIPEQSEISNQQTETNNSPKDLATTEQTEKHEYSDSEEEEFEDFKEKETDYSIFANGFCYSRLIGNTRVLAAELDCATLCMEELFVEIEKILNENRSPEDKTSVQPEADLFGMVGRLIQTTRIGKLVNLGRKWLNSYRISYLRTLLTYYKLAATEKINTLDYNLKNVMNLYLSCPQQTCGIMNESQNVSSEMNDTPLYEWIKTEVVEKNLKDDLLRVLIDDDQEIHRYIQASDISEPTKMIEDQTNQISSQTSDLINTIKKRKVDNQASSKEIEIPEPKKIK